MTKNRKKTDMTWPEAFQKTLCRMVDRGQIPTSGIILIVGLLVWKMNPDDASFVGREIVENLLNGWFLGYALAVLLSLAWFATAGRSRRRHADEIGRMAQEKKDLQQKLTNATVRSSNRNQPRKK